jgi:hypothetical protein
MVSGCTFSVLFDDSWTMGMRYTGDILTNPMPFNPTEPPQSPSAGGSGTGSGGDDKSSGSGSSSSYFIGTGSVCGTCVEIWEFCTHQGGVLIGCETVYYACE